MSLRKVFVERIELQGNTPGGQGTPNASSNGYAIPLQQYYNDFVQYDAPTQIVSNCAEIAFYNMGTSVMIVNGIEFQPLTGVALDGNEGELDVTKYNLTFSDAGNNIAFVVRKEYVNYGN